MPSGDQLPRVLLVDDERSVLDGLRRRLYGRFDVACAASGQEALELVAGAGPFAVVVSDMRMPGMDGAALLERVRGVAPESVRVLLTGYTDIDSAMAAINVGGIFRFLCKPCETDLFVKTLDDAVEQHRLVVSERELLEQTLRGSVNALLETLSLANPAAFARAVQIKDVVVAILDGLGVTDRWEIEVASMLSQLGLVTLPDSTVANYHFGLPLSQDEQAMVARLPEVADRLLAEIPRLDGVRRIVREQQAPPSQHDVSVGGRILRVAVAFASLRATGTDPSAAVEMLRRRFARDDLDAEIIRQLGVPADDAGPIEVREVSLAELVPGMILETDVRSVQGTLVVARGQVVTESLAERLRNFASNNSVTGTVAVLIG